MTTYFARYEIDFCPANNEALPYRLLFKSSVSTELLSTFATEAEAQAALEERLAVARRTKELQAQHRVIRTYDIV